MSYGVTSCLGLLGLGEVKPWKADRTCLTPGGGCLNTRRTRRAAHCGPSLGV